MSALAERAGQILALLVMAAMAYLYVDGLRAKLSKAEDDTRTARQEVVDRDATITELRALQQRQEVAAAKLEGERNGIRQALNNREILMRKMQDEIPEIRAWSVAAVPDPVVRLREHGPISGAAAYRQFLSQSPALPAARRPGEE